MSSDLGGIPVCSRDSPTVKENKHVILEHCYERHVGNQDPIKTQMQADKQSAAQQESIGSDKLTEVCKAAHKYT